MLFDDADLSRESPEEVSLYTLYHVINSLSSWTLYKAMWEPVKHCMTSHNGLSWTLYKVHYAMCGVAKSLSSPPSVNLKISVQNQWALCYWKQVAVLLGHPESTIPYLPLKMLWNISPSVTLMVGGDLRYLKIRLRLRLMMFSCLMCSVRLMMFFLDGRLAIILHSHSTTQLQRRKKPRTCVVVVNLNLYSKFQIDGR